MSKNSFTERRGDQDELAYARWAAVQAQFQRLKAASAIAAQTAVTTNAALAAAKADVASELRIFYLV